MDSRSRVALLTLHDYFSQSCANFLQFHVFIAVSLSSGSNILFCEKSNGFGSLDAILMHCFTPERYWMVSRSRVTLLSSHDHISQSCANFLQFSWTSRQARFVFLRLLRLIALLVLDIDLHARFLPAFASLARRQIKLFHLKSRFRRRRQEAETLTGKCMATDPAEAVDLPSYFARKI